MLIFYVIRSRVLLNIKLVVFWVANSSVKCHKLFSNWWKFKKKKKIKSGSTYVGATQIGVRFIRIQFQYAGSATLYLGRGCGVGEGCGGSCHHLLCSRATFKSTCYMTSCLCCLVEPGTVEMRGRTVSTFTHKKTPNALKFNVGFSAPCGSLSPKNRSVSMLLDFTTTTTTTTCPHCSIIYY